MRHMWTGLFVGIGSCAIVGCSSSSATRSREVPLLPAALGSAPTPAASDIVQAQYSPEPAQIEGVTPPTVLGLSEAIALTLERNPRLAQVGWAIEAARGRAIQAGLYPNPTIEFKADELGDRTGPTGILSVPYITQEIVRGDKLALSQAVALKEVDQATLALATERYRVLAEVRANFYDVVTLQQRAVILQELITLADKSVENANKLLKAKEASELDVVQLEVDRERYRAEFEATQRSLPAAFRRLAASMGVNDLPNAKVIGTLDTPLPDYELEQLRTYIVSIHPELRSAQLGVQRAQLAVKRAIAEPIPNITIGSGYIRQGQNRSNDWVVAASLPVPVWNKNQGGIFAAKANLGEAINEVGRVENDLVARLSTSFTTYASARKRAEKYQTAIVPKADRSYQLSLKAYQGGQFEYLRVLQAQRAIAEARLETVRSLGEQWRAASELSGLMLEDQWPPTLPTPINPETSR